MEHMDMHSMEVRRRSDSSLLMSGDMITDERANSIIAAFTSEVDHVNIYLDDHLVRFNDDGSWETDVFHGPVSEG